MQLLGPRAASSGSAGLKAWERRVIYGWALLSWLSLEVEGALEGQLESPMKGGFARGWGFLPRRCMSPQGCLLSEKPWGGGGAEAEEGLLLVKFPLPSLLDLRLVALQALPMSLAMARSAEGTCLCLADETAMVLQVPGKAVSR